MRLAVGFHAGSEIQQAVGHLNVIWKRDVTRPFVGKSASFARIRYCLTLRNYNTRKMDL